MGWILRYMGYCEHNHPRKPIHADLRSRYYRARDRKFAECSISVLFHHLQGSGVIGFSGSIPPSPPFSLSRKKRNHLNLSFRLLPNMRKYLSSCFSVYLDTISRLSTIPRFHAFRERQFFPRYINLPSIRFLWKNTWDEQTRDKKKERKKKTVKSRSRYACLSEFHLRAAE